MNYLPVITYSLILLTLIFYILSSSQQLLLPFIVAIVIWFLIISLGNGIQKLTFGKFKIPIFLSNLIALIGIFLIAQVVFTMIAGSVISFLEVAPDYQQKLVRLYLEVVNFFRLEPTFKIFSGLEDINFVNLLTWFLGFFTEIAANMGLILIYVLFLFLEYHTFDGKLKLLFPKKANYEQIRAKIDLVSEKMQVYLRIKTLLSTLTGLSSYAIMSLVGLDFVNFWAFLIFFLNYIPTIGSIVATILPCIFSIVQFESLTPFFILAVSLISIQFLIGNVLEPQLMGKSFNLSSLVIILSLAVFGKMWGILGMFLSVPILMMVKIVVDSFEQTRWIGILLSSGKNSFYLKNN